MAESKEKAVAKGLIVNLRDGAVVFGVIKIAKGKTHKLTASESKDKDLMGRLNHAANIGLVELT